MCEFESLVFQVGQYVNSYYWFSRVVCLRKMFYVRNNNVNSANLVFPSGNSTVQPMLGTYILIAGFLILFLMLVLRIWF